MKSSNASPVMPSGSESFLFEFFDNGRLALGGFPAFEEIIQVGEMPLQALPGVIPQAFRDQFAVLVQIVHPLGQHGDQDAIYIDFFARFRIV